MSQRGIEVQNLLEFTSVIHLGLEGTCDNQGVDTLT